ncbi:MAG: RNA polymerase sigma factor [Actinomycetia bacterium]|nr:RNA polymerase sigma factor [Actinomycetes bacterium]
MATLADQLERVYSTFVERHGDRALRLAYATLHDRTEAEDVAQEAFYRLWRHALRRGAECLSAPLLYQTVVNLCRDRARYRRRHPEDAVDPAELRGSVPALGDREQALVVAEAVHALKPIEQQVVLLYYYLDQSLKDTAEILGLTEQMVKTRLYRARQHLRPLLESMLREEAR